MIYVNDFDFEMKKILLYNEDEAQSRGLTILLMYVHFTYFGALHIIVDSRRLQ
jgi:hypothetical protein